LSGGLFNSDGYSLSLLPRLSLLFDPPQRLSKFCAFFGPNTLMFGFSFQVSPTNPVFPAHFSLLIPGLSPVSASLGHLLSCHASHNRPDPPPHLLHFVVFLVPPHHLRVTSDRPLHPSPPGGGTHPFLSDRPPLLHHHFWKAGIPVVFSCRSTPFPPFSLSARFLPLLKTPISPFHVFCFPTM